MNKNIHKKRNKQWKKDSVYVFARTEKQYTKTGKDRRKAALFTGKIRKTPSAMQTITQSVVESHTKLVYKYIKQDVEAENNHTAKGRVEQMGTPTEIYKNPKTPFVAQFIGESAVITDYDRLKGFHLYPGCSRAIIRPEFVKAVRYGTEKRYQSLYAEGIVEQKSRGHCIPSVCGG